MSGIQNATTSKNREDRRGLQEGGLCPLCIQTSRNAVHTLHPFPSSDEQIQGAVLGRKDFWRKMFKSQSAASDTSSQSEQDTSECTTAHSGTTTDRRSRSRSRRISLRKKLKLPIGKCMSLPVLYTYCMCRETQIHCKY